MSEEIVTHPWHKKCPYCEARADRKSRWRFFPLPLIFRAFWKNFHTNSNFREGTLLTILLVGIVAEVCTLAVWISASIFAGVFSPPAIISGVLTVFIFPPILYTAGTAV